MDKILDDLLAQKLEERNREGSFVDLRARQLNQIRTICDLPIKGTLYYPGCGSDYSPSLTFPEWNIFYLDYNIDSHIFSDKGGVVQCLKGDYTKPPFDTNVNFDVILIVSPGSHISSSEVVSPTIKHLKPGGVLVCDNYHGTKDYVAKNLSSEFKEIKLETPGELSAFRKIS